MKCRGRKGWAVGKFTDGPWKSTRIGSFCYQITTEVPRGHPNFVVIVQEVRSLENARLIAAAPELYEALQALLDITTFAENPFEAQIHAKAMDAIAKAKGEIR
jgi:hypothetical protein